MVAAGVGIGLASLAFGEQLLRVIEVAKTSDLFSYILLIPFATGYLLYLRAAELPRNFEASPWPAGLAILLTGLALLGSAKASLPGSMDQLAWQMLAYYSALLAIGFLCLGAKWMRAAAFPVFFLCFIIPWPDALVGTLEFASQSASAWAAHVAFEVTDMPVFRDGFIFELAGARIQVAQECSGIRSSVALMLSALLASNLLLRDNWHRSILVLFVVPVAIFRNGVRIWFIARLCVEYGPAMIHSAYHTQGGPYFFVLSLIPLLALLWWLARREIQALPVAR